ncbi:MAG TPA: thiamine biosynthesis protein ThiS [Blastocatellia bacterium]|nr:thiamine biosynthesis protein ThiS [Blastocatellia bacterium]
MEIILNGEKREVPANIDLNSLLEHFGLPKQRIAVELNYGVIRRRDWASTPINQSDRIEVIHFVGGG